MAQEVKTNSVAISRFGYPNSSVKREGDVGSSHENKLSPVDGVAPLAALYQQGTVQSSHRFYLSIRGINVAFITNVSRPSYTIATEEAKLLNWSFSYPTTITWDPINFTVREIFDGFNQQTILGLFYKKLTDYSWNPPNFNFNDNQILNFIDKDLSKRSLKESLGPVIIKSLNEEGQTVEEWELHGAYITSVKPSALNYEQATLTSIDVSVKYDFATLKVVNGSTKY